MKQLFLPLFLALAFLTTPSVHADFQTTFIANPDIAALELENHLTQYVQRSFMRANIKAGNIVYGATPEAAKNYATHIYVTPGMLFNQETYIDQHFYKVPLTPQAQQIIKYYTRELMKEVTQDSAYLKAISAPTFTVFIVAIIIAAIVASDKNTHCKDNSCHNNDTYLDTRRALRDHDDERAIAQENATIDKFLIFNEKTSVGFSNNHLNRLKDVFKNTSKIPHFITALVAGVLTGITTGIACKMKFDKKPGHENGSVVFGVIATIIGSGIAGGLLEYQANKINKDYVDSLKEHEIIV